jgi:multiple sugar transport system permease protein
MVALVFRTLSAFLIFDIIYIMTGGGPGNSTNVLAYLNYTAFINNSDFGYGGAVSVLLVVIAMLIAAAYVRVFRTDYEVTQ